MEMKAENEKDRLVDSGRIRRFYEKHINSQHAMNHTAVGWSKVEVAHGTYEAAIRWESLPWPQIETVLDVGSGLGQLMPHMRKHLGYHGHYTGLELIPQFHTQALKAWGSAPQSTWLQGKFLSYNFGDRRFDWVFSLGSFSVKQNNPEAHDLAMLKKVLLLAKHGFTIYLNDVRNLSLNKIMKFSSGDLALHDPEQFVGNIKELVPTLQQVQVVHYPTPSSQHAMVHVLL